MENWDLRVKDEAWSLLPFKKLLDRDKSKEKEISLKEMAFIYHYSDIKSDYGIIADLELRKEEIKRDVGLPEDWDIDSDVEVAIELYRNYSKTIITKLYEDAMVSANAIGSYLRNTDALLKERDANEKPVTTIQTIVGALNNVNKLIKELKILEKEIVKEEKIVEDRMKGSQVMSMFEEGLNFEED